MDYCVPAARAGVDCGGLKTGLGRQELATGWKTGLGRQELATGWKTGLGRQELATGWMGMAENTAEKTQLGERSSPRPELESSIVGAALVAAREWPRILGLARGTRNGKGERGTGKGERGKQSNCQAASNRLQKDFPSENRTRNRVLIDFVTL